MGNSEMSNANNENAVTITDGEQELGQKYDKGENRKREVKLRSKVWEHFRSVQVRCWGHILNLIVHEGLDETKVCI
ncbi:hypothetical protein ACH5RR_000874 [Cinchona calisaya]|uniref:Uncharacterized protein n=1 Tax=Cinchona calisaya TaxID=153742 RepID=A0ABD3B2G8_9GENT